MQIIRYRITSLLPLLFASNTGDTNMVATLDYITGTHLRGMFANEYIKRKGIGKDAHKDETFYKWFLKGELKITNAYITAEIGNRVCRFLPIPFSIQREKGAEDIAYDLLFQNEDFDKQTKGIDGYGLLEGDKLTRKSVKRSLNFHHARDREKGVSKKGLIFNYESIKEGQPFECYIIGNTDDLKEFSNIITDGIYYLGRSRNNQYGKIKFEIISPKPEDFFSEIEPAKVEDKVVLTLLSDTIIYNENGYSTTDIKHIEKELGCTIKKAFIRQSEKEGFISVWRLKSPSEVCFKAGSSFLIEIKDGDLDRLKELQKTGIGMRTHEGFGRFVIGLQREDREINIKDCEKENVPKPSSDVSEKLRSMLKKVIKDAIVKNLQYKAITNAKNFKNLPPGSLLVKLEALVKDGKLKEFLGDENIKKTAKNHLERCRNNNKTLYEHLKEYKIDIEAILNERQDIRGLCSEISYEASDIKAEYGDEFKKTYLTILLSTMRKTLKQGGKKDV